MFQAEVLNNTTAPAALPPPAHTNRVSRRPAALARRGLLGLAAAVAGGHGRTGGAAGADATLLAACAKHMRLQAASDALAAEYAYLRAELVGRYGEPRGAASAAELWGGDASWPHVDRLCAECDAFSNALSELVDLIVDMPPVSVAGVVMKIRFTISLWSRGGDVLEQHEEAAMAVLRDTEAVLALAGAAEFGGRA